jgi:hypothetical protein
MDNIPRMGNPLADLMANTIEATRVDIGGSSASVLGPASLKGRQAGTVSTSGQWEPYGRIGITPVGNFRVAK